MQPTLKVVVCSLCAEETDATHGAGEESYRLGRQRRHRRNVVFLADPRLIGCTTGPGGLDYFPLWEGIPAYRLIIDVQSFVLSVS